MKPKARGDKLGEGCFKPSQEVFKVEGRVSYHEGLRAWGKIILKKEIVKLFKELQNKDQAVNYLMTMPKSIEECQQYIEELYKNEESKPLFLMFKPMENISKDSD